MSKDVADTVRAYEVPTIAVNDTARLAPWAHMLYACDYTWWMHHANWALKFRGLKVTIDDSVPFPAVLCLRTHRDNTIGNPLVSGLETDSEYIRTGNNSGYQAVSIAIHAGATRILLCGFDMAGGHWFGSHPPGLTDADPNVHRNLFIPEFEKLAKILPAGVEIINCTPGSALQCFPMGNLEEELRRASIGNSTTAS